MDAKAETLILWPPDAKNWLIRKGPDAGKDWRQEEKGTTEDEIIGWHHWLNGHEWVNSESWWWTGRPGVLQSMGVAKSRTWLSDWTELNWTECSTGSPPMLNPVILSYGSKGKQRMTFSWASGLCCHRPKHHSCSVFANILVKQAHLISPEDLHITLSRHLKKFFPSLLPCRACHIWMFHIFHAILAFWNVWATTGPQEFNVFLMLGNVIVNFFGFNGLTAMMSTVYFFFESVLLVLLSTKQAGKSKDKCWGKK